VQAAAPGGVGGVRCGPASTRHTFPDAGRCHRRVGCRQACDRRRSRLAGHRAAARSGWLARLWLVLPCGRKPRRVAM
jgi:hypothetical protein